MTIVISPEFSLLLQSIWKRISSGGQIGATEQTNLLLLAKVDEFFVNARLHPRKLAEFVRHKVGRYAKATLSPHFNSRRSPIHGI